MGGQKKEKPQGVEAIATYNERQGNATLPMFLFDTCVVPCEIKCSLKRSAELHLSLIG